MPNRIIRDGINTSPRINALSDGAELFYRRLLSVVDDYGRYYGHAATLRAAAWPTRPNRHNDEEVVAWLNELTSGDNPLLLAYSVDGAPYIQMDSFGQRVQSRPKFPAPPTSGGDNGGGAPKSTVKHGEIPHADARFPTVKNGESRKKTKKNTYHTNTNTDTDTYTNRAREDPKTPVEIVEISENVVRSSSSFSQITEKRKDPDRATTSGGAVDLSGFRDEDITIVRNTLRSLAQEFRLPDPDDGIVRQVLDAGRGASGKEIYDCLRRLWLERQFQNIRSWGLVPVVLAPWFRRRAAS